MKTGKTVKTMIVFIIFIAACVAVFFFVSNKTDENENVERESAVMTAVQEVLARNLDSNYPPTPKEVLKYYCEITRCFYSEKYSEEELKKLAKKSRALFDDELYATQTDDEYYEELLKEIARFKEENRAVSSYSVSSSTDVNEYYYGGYDWAQLYCIFSVRTGTTMSSVQEKFLMRKDEKGHWKILGWELAEDEGEEE